MDPEREYGYYAVIPVSVLQDRRLKPNSKLLYGQISSLSTKQGYCYATDSKLSQDIAVSPNSVNKFLKELEDCGYIYRETTMKSVGKARKIFLLANQPNGVLGQAKQSVANTPNGVFKPLDKRIDKSIDNTTRDAAEQIYQLVKEKINPAVRLTDKGYDTIKTRLKTFSLDDLKAAVDKFTYDNWRMKYNRNKTFSWYFRSDEQVETWLAIDKHKVMEDDLI